MERIFELIKFYSEKGNDTIEVTVKKLWEIYGAKDKDEAFSRAVNALSHLKAVSYRKDHVNKLKAFLYDLKTGQVVIQIQI